MSKKKLFIMGIISAGLLIQLIPMSRTNPVSTGTMKAPPAIVDILKRSCYDCHSHETRWPWYSSVAPASWLIAHDVKEGRQHLNFSAWADYSDSGRIYLMEKIVKEVSDGDMPPAPYAWMHSGAAVSTGDLKLLKEWGDSEKNKGPTAPLP